MKQYLERKIETSFGYFDYFTSNVNPVHIRRLFPANLSVVIVIGQL